MLVLHHATDPLAVLSRVRPALRPGGKLLIMDMQPHERTEYREQMGHQWLGFEEAQLRTWLSDAGFASCRIVPLPPAKSARGPALFAATATVPLTAYRLPLTDTEPSA
jgi:ArsR family transcriptional regulator